MTNTANVLVTTIVAVCCLSSSCVFYVDGPQTIPKPETIVWDDECWIPLPEKVPTDDLFALAQKLVNEDQFALRDPRIVQNDEVSLLLAILKNARQDMTQSVTKFVTPIANILSRNVADVRTAEFFRQREAAARKFYQTYHDTFLSSYENEYREKITTTGCRPLRMDEEGEIVWKSRSIAVEKARLAASSERSCCRAILTDDDCITQLEFIPTKRMKFVQKVALNAASFAAQNRGDPLDEELCGKFHDNFRRIVRARYILAYDEMRIVLGKTAMQMERNATMAQPFIESLAYLYALDKVISEVQSETIDVYRTSTHPTLDHILRLISRVHRIQEQYDSELTGQFTSEFKNLGIYLQTAETILIQNIDKKILDSGEQTKLVKLEQTVSALDDNISQYYSSSKADDEDASSVGDSLKGGSWWPLNRMNQNTESGDIEFEDIEEDIEEDTEEDVTSCDQQSRDLATLLSGVEKEFEEIYYRKMPVTLSDCSGKDSLVHYSDYDVLRNHISNYNRSITMFMENQIVTKLHDVDNSKPGLPILLHLAPWTAHIELPENITAAFDGRDVGTVYQFFRVAIQRAGLESHVYRFGSRGLALVTQFEKIEDNGRPFPSEERWNVSAIPSTESWGMLDQFFKVRTGRYRFFILLLTDPDDFHPTGENASWKEAMQITKYGGGMPNDELLSQSIGGLKTAVLVYEYFRKGEHSEPQFVETHLTARRHIVAARLWMDNQFEAPINFEEMVASKADGVDDDKAR